MNVEPNPPEPQTDQEEQPSPPEKSVPDVKPELTPDAWVKAGTFDWLWLFGAVYLHLMYFLSFFRAHVFWRDEAHAWNLAVAPADQFLRFFDYVEHQTSYLVMLRLISSVWSNPHASTFFSLASALAGAALLGLLARRFYRSTPAGITCSCLALLALPLLTHNNAVTRPYAFAFLLHTAVIYAVFRLYRRYSVKGLVLTALLAIISMNAQPVNLVAGYALAGLWFALLLGRRLTNISRAAVSQLVIPPALLIGCSIPMMIQSLRFSRAMKGVEPATELGALSLATPVNAALDLLASTVQPLHALYLFCTAEDFVPNLGYILSHPISLVAFALLAGAVGAAAWKRLPKQLLTRITLGPGLLFIISLTGLWLASLMHTRMIESTRSFSALAPPFILLAGWCLARIPAVRHLALFSLVSFSLFAWAPFDARSPGRFSDAEAIADAVTEQALDTDLVLLANAQLGPSFHLYYDGPGELMAHPYTNSVPFWDMVGLGKKADASDSISNTLARINEAAGNGQRVWLITSGSPAPESTRYWYSPESLPKIEAALTTQFTRTEYREGESKREPMFLSLFEPAEEKEEAPPAEPEPAQEPESE